MFDKRLVCTGAALIITLAIAIVLANIPEREEEVPIQEPVSAVEESIPKPPASASSSQQPQYAYLVKEHEGRVAVFVPGAEEPQMVFDTQVKFLPDYDRIQMKNGIPVTDYAALSAIIEDYIS